MAKIAAAASVSNASLFTIVASGECGTTSPMCLDSSGLNSHWATNGGGRYLLDWSFNAAESLGRHHCCRVAVAGDSNICCARAWKAACDSSLARLWLFAWLSFARTDRMGAGAKSRSGFLLGCPTGILPRALEWRWLRSLLDADADRADVELRSIVDFGQKWPLLQSNEATDG